jgi:hypothetical protein
MSEPLHGYQNVWEQKPVLAVIYDDFYDRIIGACVPGRSIEIGGGIGNLKRRMGAVIATDIQFAPWLDCVADAQFLPFGEETIANIVMVDVLHHVEFPSNFFQSAASILQVGGRILMVEPAITWGSSLFYRLLHHEPVQMTADSLVEGRPNPERDPYASNQAIPTLIATRDQHRFHARFPSLRIRSIDWFSLLAYPLSAGFKRWSLIPARLAPRLLKLEASVEQWVGRWLAFRVMLVIEKRAIVEDSVTGAGPPFAPAGSKAKN